MRFLTSRSRNLYKILEFGQNSWTTIFPTLASVHYNRICLSIYVLKEEFFPESGFEPGCLSLHVNVLTTPPFSQVQNPGQRKWSLFKILQNMLKFRFYCMITFFAICLYCFIDNVRERKIRKNLLTTNPRQGQLRRC